MGWREKIKARAAARIDKHVVREQSRMGREMAAARDRAKLLAAVEGGESQAAAGRRLGITRQAVHKQLKKARQEAGG